MSMIDGVLFWYAYRFMYSNTQWLSELPEVKKTEPSTPWYPLCQCRMADIVHVPSLRLGWRVTLFDFKKILMVVTPASSNWVTGSLETKKYQWEARRGPFAIQNTTCWQASAVAAADRKAVGNEQFLRRTLLTFGLFLWWLFEVFSRIFWFSKVDF